MSDGQSGRGAKPAVTASHGMVVVLAGLGAVTLIFAVTALRVETAQLASVASAAVGVIGTIVGAYFGVQVGASSRARAERARDVAQERAFLLAGVTEPERYAALRTANRDLFDSE